MRRENISAIIFCSSCYLMNHSLNASVCTLIFRLVSVSISLYMFYVLVYVPLKWMVIDTGWWREWKEKTHHRCCFLLVNGDVFFKFQTSYFLLQTMNLAYFYLNLGKASKKKRKTSCFCTFSFSLYKVRWCDYYLILFSFQAYSFNKKYSDELWIHYYIY